MSEAGACTTTSLYSGTTGKEEKQPLRSVREPRFQCHGRSKKKNIKAWGKRAEKPSKNTKSKQEADQNQRSRKRGEEGIGRKKKTWDRTQGRKKSGLRLKGVSRKKCPPRIWWLTKSDTVEPSQEEGTSGKQEEGAHRKGSTPKMPKDPYQRNGLGLAE